MTQQQHDKSILGVRMLSTEQRLFHQVLNRRKRPWLGSTNSGATVHQAAQGSRHLPRASTAWQADQTFGVSTSSTSPHGVMVSATHMILPMRWVFQLSTLYISLEMDEAPKAFQLLQSSIYFFQINLQHHPTCSKGYIYSKAWQIILKSSPIECVNGSQTRPIPSC